MTKVRNALVALAAASLAACATAPEDIRAAYVSPAQYASYDCAQIAAEASRVATKAEELSGKQRAERSKDQAAAGVGLVLFAPAALFMIGGDHKQEIATLKGQNEALKEAAASKNCSVATRTL
jgi:arginase family enzyme